MTEKKLPLVRCYKGVFYINAVTAEHYGTNLEHWSTVEVMRGKVVAIYDGGHRLVAVTASGSGVVSHVITDYHALFAESWERDEVIPLDPEALAHVLEERVAEAMIEVLADRVGT